jgi:hypothetical protein
MTMVRCKNLSRHIRDQHPNGFEGEFVPCLVSSNHLRHIKHRNPPGTASVETQTLISLPPKATHYGQLQFWTHQDFEALVQLILLRAKCNCFICNVNAEFTAFNDDTFTFEPNFVFADHVDGCKAPAHLLLARYLPDLWREVGVEDLGEVVVGTHYISKILESECQRLGQ